MGRKPLAKAKHTITSLPTFPHRDLVPSLEEDEEEPEEEEEEEEEAEEEERGRRRRTRRRGRRRGRRRRATFSIYANSRSTA